MNHRRFPGGVLVVVGVALAALRVLAPTDAAGTIQTPTPVSSSEVVIVATDDGPAAVPCDIDPHFWKQPPAGPVDPGFLVPVAPERAWADVDPAFAVQIPCPLETTPRRAPEAATPVP